MILAYDQIKTQEENDLIELQVKAAGARFA